MLCIVPLAVLVFDKFHIVRCLSRTVGQDRRGASSGKAPPIRRWLMAKSLGICRCIWLKIPWALTDSPTSNELGYLGAGHLSRDKNRALLAEGSYWMSIYNGTVEGLGNKAKVVRHKVCGFIAVKSYILKLVPLHG